jgi:hypothetical protein
MISRTRRRMRLRNTAPPNVFLMLNPKRLAGRLFARQNTVKCEFDRRFPVRYTASNSPRRTSLASRGKLSGPASLGREAMTALLAPRGQNFAASNGFHARAESVRLGTPAFPRLICALWQSNPPCVYTTEAAVVLELRSLCEARAEGQGRWGKEGLGHIESRAGGSVGVR